MKAPSSPALRRCTPLLLTGGILLAALLVMLGRMNQDRGSASVATLPTKSTTAPRIEVPKSFIETTEAPARRPLPVATSSATHEWTQEDAMAPEIIERLAHNPDEFIKMVEENDRIQKRQLVYRNETAAKLIQQSRLSGEPLREFTLPGLDGQELRVEIQSAELSPSGQSGNFIGCLAGKPRSMVTLAFEFGTEAFTVLSPDDGLYLQADPREPGELIVKRIDPDTYAPFHCGNAETK